MPTMPTPSAPHLSVVILGCGEPKKSMGWFHVTQLLLDQGVFSEDDLLELFSECVERHAKEAKRAKLKIQHDPDRDKRTLQQVVDLINGNLDPLGLKVVRHRYRNGPPPDGAWQTYYGVVNLNEDDGFAKQEWLSKSEQEFFHTLVGQILGSDDGQIDAVEATNLRHDASSTAKLSGDAASKCLEQLELGQWLAKSDDGFYSLGVRTELQRRYWSDDAPAAKKSAKQARATQELDEEAEPEPQPKRARDGGGEDVD